MNAPALTDCIAARTLAGVDGDAAAFARREPFRHLVIGDFATADHAAAPLAAFPHAGGRGRRRPLVNRLRRRRGRS